VRVTLDLDPATYKALNRWLGVAGPAVDPDFPRLPLAVALRAMIQEVILSPAEGQAVIARLRRDHHGPV
jgi:hypothetical protein